MAGEMTRRGLLLTGAALAAMSPVPGAPALAALEAAPLPIWAVGTPGYYDGLIVRAATREEAILEWANIQGNIIGHYTDDDQWICDGVDPDAEAGVEVDDVSAVATVSPDASDEEVGFAIGWGWICDRCSYEASPGDWHVVEGKGVCHDCIEREEWRTIDPEYYADLIADDEDTP